MLSDGYNQPRLIEVFVDREDNIARHRQLWHDVSSALAAEVSR
jgi:hypothetical protein